MSQFLLRSVLFFAIIFFGALPSLFAQVDQVADNLRPDIILEGDTAQKLAERMIHYRTPGVSFAVIDDYALTGAATYGKITAEQPGEVTEETRFQAASISKLVNAVGVMRLVETGRLDLDQDVNRLLTSWQIPPSPKYPEAVITVRMLLSHTAGLSAHGFGGYASPDGLPSAVEVVDKSRGVNSEKVRIVQQPGVSFRYSGGGTTVIQLIIEDLTGKPYTEYMQEAVLAPLGMSKSFYSVDQKGKEGLLATAHSANGKPLKNKYQHYPESAAAGLWTTPTDLSKLMIDLMLALKGETGKLLRTATVEAMFVPPVEGENNALGLFLRSKGDQVYFEHGGSNEGFKANFVGNASTGQGAVVMINAEQYDLIPEVVNAVASVFDWPEWFGPNSTLPDVEIDKSAWKGYEGHYVSEADETKVLNFNVKKGRLRISRPKEWTLDLIPVSQRKYLVKGATPAVTVKFLADGRLEVVQGKTSYFQKQ